MKLVDANVLLYAVNRQSAHHEAVRRWWEAAMSDEEPIAFSWTVLLGFLRLATSASVFPKPLGIEQATECVDAWLRHPNTRVIAETAEHWRILKDLLLQSGTAGNLTTDAHLAALAISHGATLCSCDLYFGRFRPLRWENPVAG